MYFVVNGKLTRDYILPCNNVGLICKGSYPRATDSVAMVICTAGHGIACCATALLNVEISHTD